MAARGTKTPTYKPVKQSKPRSPGKVKKRRRAINRKIGRPPLYTEAIGNKFCRLVAAGSTIKDAADELGVTDRAIYFWMLDRPGFLQSYERARDIRAGVAFPEQMVDIASNDASDWNYNPETKRLSVNKEAMLRSKLKIEVRQWHASRRHPQEWGDRQQIELKNDYSLMSEDQRIAKALELIGVIKEITGPRPQPPPLRYDPGTEEVEPEPSGIGD